VPLLGAVIPLRQAAPLAVLVSVTVALIVVVQDWEKIDLRSTAWLLLPTLAGIPVGLLLLTHGPEQIVKATLAVFILAFSLYCLIGRAPLELSRDSPLWLLGCGFLAGLFGGAYGMNGPPLAIYGSMRRWSAPQFRATLQAYFLPASLVGMAGYWLAGLWVPVVTHDFLISLPAVIPAVFLGRGINQRLNPSAFARYVYLGLAGIGVLLFAQALRLPWVPGR
jgi:uncharacterized protein